jgi:hypothetical protein
VAAAARAALAVIVAANGWVASTRRVMCSARRKAARPSAPPKPPIRTSPSGSRGRLTRPASEEITSAPAAVSSAASSRASPVPPRMRVRTG